MCPKLSFQSLPPTQISEEPFLFCSAMKAFNTTRPSQAMNNPGQARMPIIQRDNFESFKQTQGSVSVFERIFRHPVIIKGLAK